MGWVKEALEEIKKGNSVRVRPQGGSMRGKIESGQEVELSPISDQDIKIGDVVLVKWKGNYLLHLVKNIQDSQILIANNLGKENGWVAVSAVVAKVTDIAD